MKKLILISILLNLGLVGVIAHFSTQRKAQSTEAATEGSALTEKSEAKGKRSAKKEIVMVNAKGEKFSWRDVESEDYKNYIVNLRTILCPEETLRDIIIADVNKFYANKLKPLRKPVEEFKFWKNENNWGGGRRENDEYYKAQMEIEKEKRALLKELLGSDYEKEIAKQYGWSDQSQDSFNEKLPQETKDKLSEIQRKFGEQQSEIYRKAKGYHDEYVQADLKKIEKERRAEMAKILSPEDLFEWDLRNSQTAQNMKWNELQGFDTSEEEFRAIFKAKLAAEDARTDGSTDKTAREESMKTQKEAQDALKATLGEDRYKEYQMAQNYEYRELLRIADKQGVAKEDVLKVYDMKADVEKAARAINADKTLTPEARREKLLAIKQVTEQEVTGTLGDRGYKAWKRNAWWLRNIVPPEPSKSTSTSR